MDHSWVQRYCLGQLGDIAWNMREHMADAECYALFNLPLLIRLELLKKFGGLCSQI